MEVVIGSKWLEADVAQALDVAGREHLVVAAKSTWTIPGSGQRPRPLPPLPLEHSDLFFGSPENSAMRYGADFARFKPACDVLFDASAHSPTGEPVTEMTAAWSVGPLRKALRVIGPRTWTRKLGRFGISDPTPFLRMPLHAGLAFGGTRTYTKGKGIKAETLSEALIANPIGMGWAGPNTLEGMEGQPLPRIEPLNGPTVRSPKSASPSVSFSAVARHWEPRRALSGTYDEAWERDVFPLLPTDFDDRFHQCAPIDQQMPYPTGGEAVVLRNMMAGRPDVRFNLPKLDGLAVRIQRNDYSTETLRGVADTLFFEPDMQRFSVVWRASIPLRRRYQEMLTIAIGPVNEAWWESRAMGLDGSCFTCGDTQAQEA